MAGGLSELLQRKGGPARCKGAGVWQTGTNI